MEDKEFYKQLLGVIDPWKVIDVKMMVLKQLLYLEINQILGLH